MNQSPPLIDFAMELLNIDKVIIVACAQSDRLINTIWANGWAVKDIQSSRVGLRKNFLSWLSEPGEFSLDWRCAALESAVDNVSSHFLRVDSVSGDDKRAAQQNALKLFNGIEIRKLYDNRLAKMQEAQETLLAQEDKHTPNSRKIS